MSTNNGGPAFPVHGQRWDRVYGDEQVNFPGLSIRDYFAAQALAGYIARGTMYDDAKAAANCYALADAMLAERAK